MPRTAGRSSSTGSNAKADSTPKGRPVTPISIFSTNNFCNKPGFQCELFLIGEGAKVSKVGPRDKGNKFGWWPPGYVW